MQVAGAGQLEKMAPRFFAWLIQRSGGCADGLVQPVWAVIARRAISMIALARWLDSQGVWGVIRTLAFRGC